MFRWFCACFAVIALAPTLRAETDLVRNHSDMDVRVTIRHETRDVRWVSDILAGALEPEKTTPLV